MEYDRKSAVSSFYGGRRSSVDALNQDFSVPPPAAPNSRTHEDASSFYNPHDPRYSRTNGDMLRGQSAGYNRTSFFDVGRIEPVKGGYDEEDRQAPAPDAAWDVYADFNNAGPRYSTAFGMGQSDSRCVFTTSGRYIAHLHVWYLPPAVTTRSPHTRGRQKSTKNLVRSAPSRWSLCLRLALNGRLQSC